jgi:hypothetical protein
MIPGAVHSCVPSDPGWFSYRLEPNSTPSPSSPEDQGQWQFSEIQGQYFPFYELLAQCRETKKVPHANWLLNSCKKKMPELKQY